MDQSRKQSPESPVKLETLVLEILGENPNEEVTDFVQLTPEFEEENEALNPNEDN